MLKATRAAGALLLTRVAIEPGSRLSLRPVVAREAGQPAPGPKGPTRGTSRNSTSAMGRAAAITCRLRCSNSRQDSPWPLSSCRRPARLIRAASSCRRLGSRSGCWAASRPQPTSCSRATSRLPALSRASASLRPAARTSTSVNIPRSQPGSRPAHPSARTARASHCKRRDGSAIAAISAAGPGRAGSGRGAPVPCLGQCVCRATPARNSPRVGCAAKPRR